MHEKSEPISSVASGAAELLLHFLDGKARTKSELAATTGVSRVTVSARIDVLLRTGLLRYDGTESSSGGRPPARVAFNKDAGFVLAIDLGATRVTVAIINLAAEILHVKSAPMSIVTGPESVLDAIFEIADELLEAVPRELLFGVGIGLPGAIEHLSGRPSSAPLMPGWEGFPVRDYAQTRFSVPVLVENDVNILALGEHELSWPSTDALVFVKVATGLGGGIVLGGKLQRGGQGVAGDIGHIWMPHNPDLGWSLKAEHTLGTTASGRGIAAELRARGIDVADAEAVARLLVAGDQTAADVVRNAGREIGDVLSMIVNTLNPSIIVIGGSIARASEHLIAGIRETVYRRALPIATQDLQVVLSRGGENAGALGAATLVLGEILSLPQLSARIERSTRE
jgi:predicted NBD/HSP70 family sugar kinase